MTRDQLEHAIRAACDVSKDTELWIFGSQAILGEFPNAPESLRASMGKNHRKGIVSKPNAMNQKLSHSKCTFITNKEEWETEADLNRDVSSMEYTKLLALLDMSSEPPEISFEKVLSSSGLDAVKAARKDTSWT